MSEQNIDRIIAKYDRKQGKHSHELAHTQMPAQNTQRKGENKDRDITFMDEEFTPQKGHKQGSMDSQVALKCLDETERKLALS